MGSRNITAQLTKSRSCPTINSTKKNMKKIVLLSAIIASAFMANAQTAGKIFVGDNQGKPMQLGSDKSMNTVLEATKAYNAVDHDAEVALWSDEFVKTGGEKHKKSMATLKSVTNKPMAMLPIKIQGSNDEIVMVQSTEERVFKNGSKQNLNLFELFFIDKAGKISNMQQYVNIPATNEYGKTTGGKYISSKPGSEADGSTLQFSNRGEIAAIENLAKAWNSMDVKAFADIIANEVSIEAYDGTKSKLTKEMLPAEFAQYKSLDWKPGLILPFKLTNTDPASGILVYSSEKRVLKDGTVWDKELVELFGFNLAGKIDSITQFSREKTKK